MTRFSNTIAALALALVAMPLPALAEESAEAQAEQRAAATLADLAWLEGHWAGTGIGGHPAGETFSYAGDGQMVGHFWQLDENGAVDFYEIITVTPDGDSLVMRIKHFAGDLAGWEEKTADAALHFPLRSRSETRWVFGPVTFTRPTPDTLGVSVLMKRNADGTTYTLDFSYRRVSPAAGR